MDKQQAVVYIHQMLDQEAPYGEIVRQLANHLHAPESMVTKFVTQVETEYRKNRPQILPKPVPPQLVKLPPWLAELSGGQSLSEGQPPTGQQPILPDTQPEEPQMDWMQQLAQGADGSNNAAPAALEVSLPNWAVSAEQTADKNASNPVPAPPSWENEALTFVTAQLKIGRLHSDIASELADRQGIPLDRAESFVANIASQVESAPLTKITNTAQAADFVNDEYARGRPKLEIAADLSARTGEPQNLTVKFVALTLAKAEKSKAQQSAPPAKSTINLDNTELEKFVVSELTKNRKRSDIVLAICERTGVEWSEALRFVGQVNAEQQTQINARKNRLIVPMCIGAVALGFVFTIGTSYPMVFWITGRTAEFLTNTQSIGSMGDYLQVAPYIFVTGIALVAGGVIGLITALRSQME